MTAEQVRGKRANEVLGTHQFAAVLSHLKAALDGEPQVFEREIPECAGEPRQLKRHYVPDVVNGEVVGAFALLVDITDRRKLPWRWSVARGSDDSSSITRHKVLRCLALTSRFLRVNEALSIELDRDSGWLLLRKFTDAAGSEESKFIEHASQLSQASWGGQPELRLPGETAAVTGCVVRWL